MGLSMARRSLEDLEAPWCSAWRPSERWRGRAREGGRHQPAARRDTLSFVYFGGSTTSMRTESGPGTNEILTDDGLGGVRGRGSVSKTTPFPLISAAAASMSGTE